MGLKQLCGQKGALSAFSGHNKLVTVSLNEKTPSLVDTSLRCAVCASVW